MRMQDELFADPHHRRNTRRGAAGAFDPGLPARLLARARSWRLDGELAGGIDPARTRALSARAATLTSRCTRADLAGALRRLTKAASEPARNGRVTPHRAAVRMNEPAINSLAERLESPEPLYAPGLARLVRLLSDSTGPAYRGDASSLALELSLVEAQLAGTWTTTG